MYFVYCILVLYVIAQVQKIIHTSSRYRIIKQYILLILQKNIVECKNVLLDEKRKKSN